MSDDSSTSAMPKKPVNIEREIRLTVEERGEGKYVVTSHGMFKFGKPELIMHVQQGYYLAAACRIMNDTARFLVEVGNDPETGQRVQLGPWTVVEFNREGLPRDTLELRDGSSAEFFH